MEKFGVSWPDGIVEEIEDPLEYGDSRSGRILELVRVGLQAEEKMAEHQIHTITTQEKLKVVRAALDGYAEE